MFSANFYLKGNHYVGTYAGSLSDLSVLQNQDHAFSRLSKERHRQQNQIPKIFPLDKFSILRTPFRIVEPQSAYSAACMSIKFFLIKTWTTVATYLRQTCHDKESSHDKIGDDPQSHRTAVTFSRVGVFMRHGLLKFFVWQLSIRGENSEQDKGEKSNRHKEYKKKTKKKHKLG